MKANDPITLLIVSDNHIVRSGLRRILESQRFTMIADLSVREANAAAASLKYHAHVVLIDLDTSGSDAFSLIAGLKKNQKNSVILVMSDLEHEGRARKAMELGAAGVVLKLQPPSVLIAAIESLSDQQSEETELRKAEPGSSRFHSGARSDRDMGKMASLTERERDIVELIATGLKNKDIADQLHISDITVRHHLTNVFTKLGVSSRQKLLLLAHRHGFVKATADPEMR